MTAITFHTDPSDLPDAPFLGFIGRRDRLQADDVRALLPSDLGAAAWDGMLGRGDPGDDGRVATSFVGAEEAVRVHAGVLPERCSRHNAPSRAHAIPRLASAACKQKTASLVLALDDLDHLAASVLGVARAAHTYSGRSRAAEHHLHLVVLGPDGPVDAAHLAPAAAAVQRAAAWVDMPPNQLTTDAFVEEAEQVVARLGGRVTLTVIRGEALRDGGFGGLWAVGKASAHPPALAVLDHVPDEADGHDAWVGKGIVYDTGGLSIKTKTGMPGMKMDMGGAAAVLAAFEAAVLLGTSRRLTAVLCLAENSVGADSTRPDDIIEMFSGRTVEVNNTDAEGRLVLADGVAWASKERAPDRIVDLATLTGAQLIATGKRHAAIYTPHEDLETEAWTLGRRTGDLVHPLPFAPELHVREFKSEVADLKNSVKDRANAQSSCAGEFIRQHLLSFEGRWLHVDMAGPATRGGRGTGYGVGLLLGLAGCL